MKQGDSIVEICRRRWISRAAVFLSKWGLAQAPLNFDFYPKLIPLEYHFATG
jgi:hypothetical protein